ncbi:GNAT family N-acetyltransferase [Thaumasiovibrio subtropicus]|uniref:GNAT family N-acetyltransferase n=1 Tax=Thaumasiovibrio subtropicus TaxID=1891207 RepID=UPI00131BE31B|nr:GNAT family N-acetyltransferase [Thaumasiovibrio subtropicus]
MTQSHQPDMRKLHTARLELTQVSEAALPLYMALFTDKDVCRYLPGGKPFSREYIQDYLGQKIAHWRHGYGIYIIHRNVAPHEAIGYVGIEHANEQHRDIRYAILPSYQRQGYALEAAKAIISDGFQRCGLHHIYGVAVKDNHASVTLLQKLGMQSVELNFYDSDDLNYFVVSNIPSTPV